MQCLFEYISALIVFFFWKFWLAHTKSLHRQHQQDQKKNHHLEQTNIVNTNSPQIVFPVNFHAKNYQLQDDSAYNLNAIPNLQPTRAASVFYEKVIPGKGVSNLATDVFGNLEQAETQKIEDPQRNHYSVRGVASVHNTPSTEKAYLGIICMVFILLIGLKLFFLFVSRSNFEHIYSII